MHNVTFYQKVNDAITITLWNWTPKELLTASLQYLGQVKALYNAVSSLFGDPQPLSIQNKFVFQL